MLVISSLFWFACTQKSPMDPNQGISDDIPRFVNIQAAPTQMPIGGSQSTIQVQLVNQHGNPLASQTVQFTTTLGTILAESMTDENGWARTTLTSGNQSGTATIKAVYNDLSVSVQVKFSSSAQGNLSITSEKSTILANGEDYTTVTVTLLGDSAQAMAGAHVFLSTSVGIVQEVVTIDENGTAEAPVYGIARQLDTAATIIARYNESDTLEVSIPLNLTGITFELSANPMAILADNNSQSTISASLKETTSQIAIANADVRFGTNLGLITSEALTTSEGIAEVALKSKDSTGVSTVIAYYGNVLTDTIEVQFLQRTQSPHQVTSVSVSDKSLLANGVDQAHISVVVKDEDQAAVEGDTIFFSVNAGVLSNAFAITDDAGIASTELIARASNIDSTCNVQIIHSGVVVSTSKINFMGVELGLTAYPKTVLADGKSTSKIQAFLKESTSKIPISDATVYFGSSLGTIVGETKTNDEGVASVLLTSPLQAGTAMVTCYYGDRIDSTVTVQFQPSIPDTILISANPRDLSADLESQSEITVIVKDEFQNPVPDGTIVNFLVNGTGTLEYTQKETANGVVINTLTSGDQPDTVQVIASVQVDETTTISSSIQIRYHVGDAYRIEVNADPDTLPANGIEKSKITARVLDANDNIIDKATVKFQANFGNIIESVNTDENGVATAFYSSTQVGLANITATVEIGDNQVSGSTTLQCIPGDPYSIEVSYDPHFMYVKDAGKNQTVTIYATVKDEKNNPVKDSTDVRFRVYASPESGEALSSLNPGDPNGYTFTIPTVQGVSQVSFTSGIRAGTARIQADVFDENGQVIVTGISTEIVIYGGPPYMEDINNRQSTHLTVTSNRLNIWYGIDTTMVTVMVGDKYNNPVQDGTAVYLTTSGGVVATTAYTNENGIANVELQAGNPLPTIDRYYNYDGLQDPNLGTVITEPTIPDMEGNIVLNSEGGRDENDGVARLLARTEGIDSGDNSIQVWDLHSVIFSQEIPGSAYRGNAPLFESPRFWSTNTGDSLDANGYVIIDPGEYAVIDVDLWDINGNPIVGGSEIIATAAPSGVKGELSWTQVVTGDPGTTQYSLRLYNTIDPTKEEDNPGWVNVVIEVKSRNGDARLTTDPVYLDKPVVATP